MYRLLFVGLPFLVGGCGIGVSSLPEYIDRYDTDATFHLERQIKRAIYCELHRATADIRMTRSPPRLQDKKVISTPEDDLFPDGWGVLVQLTIQADEKSSLTPGVSFKTPLHNAPVNFPGETIGATGLAAATTYGPLSVAQSYSLGFGGQLSSQNVHYDKYNFFYSAKDLAINSTEGSVCRSDFLDGEPKSNSSPFLDASNLGIYEWLTTAVRVINFQRSSRIAENAEGPPLGMQGTASDSSNFDNKFIIITSGNISPNWNLVRIGTPTSPLFDANRTRTHELLMTVGSAIQETKKETTKKRGDNIDGGFVPSSATSQAHFAALIGSAVANAIRP